MSGEYHVATGRYDGAMPLEPSLLDSHGARTVEAWLRAARTRIDDADAQWLMAHALRRPRSWLYAHGDALLGEDDAGRFMALLARRIAGEPVAYLTGERGFHGLELAVTPDTLIPRPETELLVELALQRIASDRVARIADLGTGSGAIALAIARERPQAQILASDRSAAALAIARANAQRLAIGNVEFREGDWWQPFANETFDLIASNPPYIEDDDAHLSQSDLRYEPRTALASGKDGLDAIRVIVRDAPRHLHPGGWLLLEHGWQQGDAVRELMAKAGFVDDATEQDLEHRDRVTSGRIP